MYRMIDRKHSSEAFPTDIVKYRPSKIIFRVDVLREIDRAVDEGVGGYVNRHELVNDLVEQGLIDLRYPGGQSPEPSGETAWARLATPSAEPNGNGAPSEAAESSEALSGSNSPDELFSLRIKAPRQRGVIVENELARISTEPMFGMHNRDAPTAWALARLASEAMDGPVSLADFYERTTDAAWRLGAQLARLEQKGAQKLAIMLPRNAEKPQSAAAGFRAFALGQVASKPEDGMLTAWGPFYQWGAVGIVGDIEQPKIGLTDSGWELVGLFDDLGFALPHDGAIAWGFLAHLREYAAPDLWGLLAALEGAAHGLGRVEMSEWFRLGLDEDFTETEWKNSVAESVASGYVSRCRAWGLLEPKLERGQYKLTPAGRKALDDYSDAVGFRLVRAQYERRFEDGIVNG